MLTSLQTMSQGTESMFGGGKTTVHLTCETVVRAPRYPATCSVSSLVSFLEFVFTLSLATAYAFQKLPFIECSLCGRHCVRYFLGIASNPC